MTKTTDSTALQSSLETLHQRITLLKQKKLAASAKLSSIDEQIKELYEKPLNPRQSMQMMLRVIDARMEDYVNDILNSGFVEAQQFHNGQRLSFEQYERINGRSRLRGKNSYVAPDLIYRFDLVKNFGTALNTWQPFVLYHLMKEHVYATHVKLYIRKVINPIRTDPSLSDAEKESAIKAIDQVALKIEFDNLDGVEELGNAIRELNDLTAPLEREIADIDAEVADLSRPINSFMRAVQ